MYVRSFKLHKEKPLILVDNKTKNQSLIEFCLKEGVYTISHSPVYLERKHFYDVSS